MLADGAGPNAQVQACRHSMFARFGFKRSWFGSQHIWKGLWQILCTGFWGGQHYHLGPEPLDLLCKPRVQCRFGSWFDLTGPNYPCGLFASYAWAQLRSWFCWLSPVRKCESGGLCGPVPPWRYFVCRTCSSTPGFTFCYVWNPWPWSFGAKAVSFQWTWRWWLESFVGSLWHFFQRCRAHGSSVWLHWGIPRYIVTKQDGWFNGQLPTRKANSVCWVWPERLLPRLQVQEVNLSWFKVRN